MRIPLNRRHFLGTTALAGTWLAARTGSSALADDPIPGPSPLPPARIFKLYAGRTGDDYLTRPTEELGRIDAYLAGVENTLGDVRFIGGAMVPPTEIPAVAAQLQDADALLIVHLSHHGGDAPVLAPLLDVGRPTALFSQPFSGHGWMDFPVWRKQGKRVVLAPSSDWSELDRLAGLLRAAAWMPQTRILAIGGPNGTAPACSPEIVKKALGAELVSVPNDRVMEYFRAVDPKAAETEAQTYWFGPARRIVEPSPAEIVDSARLYLAIKALMADEHAQAVCSRHCMGTPRGCLSFSKLNDEGLVGACEGDIDSTLTMLLFAYAFRVPGFISDPVVDTAKNALVHFHCTSATKMDGPRSARLPFTIRTQTDSRGGVSLEVENRIGQPVTCAKLVNAHTLLYCPGTITETSTSPLACRTQFTQSVADARRLFLNWGADVVEGDTMTRLHRVVFYGDFRRPIHDLCDLLGLDLIEEGGPAITHA
jgi:hypothetical protein